MQNILSAFKVTGIYPVDRTKVLQKVITTESKPSKLPYIPLLTPTPRKMHSHACTSSANFSEDEVESFLKRNDDDEEEKYQLWRKMYEPEYLVSEHPSLSDSFLLTPTKSGASKASVAVLPKSHSSLLTPTKSGASKSVAVLPKAHSSLLHMFKLPPPVHVKPVPKKNPQKPFRVLTSTENLKLIEEKEKKKKEVQEKKREEKEGARNEETKKAEQNKAEKR